MGRHVPVIAKAGLKAFKAYDRSYVPYLTGKRLSLQSHLGFVLKVEREFCSLELPVEPTMGPLEARGFA